ncbi:uncharacterized protein BXZ73DRAFT_105265 [Epithele typhae]|uniref:uncharacterized protein n=1 Tax=Epithele typhae TaxID=378194 RepID=UPI002008E683|nr:uncharacterized protein BXZ73DRAFT_105265 [Epithele typhae]KAH9918387.1 hypothetical protein BXZ73DRAFT_105265 [Epithele typhae]
MSILHLSAVSRWMKKRLRYRSPARIAITQSSMLLNLPDEMILRILSHLDVTEILACAKRIVREATVDVAQNLVVVFTSVLGTWSAEFHLLSLDDTKPHHFAGNSVFHSSLLTPGPDDHPSIMIKTLQIRERYLSYVIASHQWGSSDVEIWDWTVQEKIWSHHYESWWIMQAIIGDDIIIVSSAARNTLDVYDFTSDSAHNRPLFSISLPPATGGKAVRIVDMHTSNPPKSTFLHPVGPSRPFQVDPASAIISVEFTVRDVSSIVSGFHGAPHDFTLLIPHSTIRTLVGSTTFPRGHLYPWSEWGPRGSALLHCTEAQSAHVVLRPYGPLFPVVCMDKRGPPPWPAAFIDLNPWARYRPPAEPPLDSDQGEEEAQAARERDAEVQRRVRPMLFDDPDEPERYREFFAAPVRTKLLYTVHTGPGVFFIGSRATTRVDAVDGGLVAVYEHEEENRTLGFDIYTV